MQSYKSSARGQLADVDNQLAPESFPRCFSDMLIFVLEGQDGSPSICGVHRVAIGLAGNCFLSRFDFKSAYRAVRTV
jgi:hypothetical protein